jgi:hypothetical protein
MVLMLLPLPGWILGVRHPRRDCHGGRHGHDLPGHLVSNMVAHFVTDGIGFLLG